MVMGDLVVLLYYMSRGNLRVWGSILESQLRVPYEGWKIIGRGSWLVLSGLAAALCFLADKVSTFAYGIFAMLMICMVIWLIEVLL